MKLEDLIEAASENFDDNLNDSPDWDGLAVEMADEQTPSTVEEMMSLDSADVWRMLDTKIDTDELLETGFDVLRAAVYNEIKAGVLAHFEERVKRGEITFDPPEAARMFDPPEASS